MYVRCMCVYTCTYAPDTYLHMYTCMYLNRCSITMYCSSAFREGSTTDLVQGIENTYMYMRTLCNCTLKFSLTHFSERAGQGRRHCGG